MAHLSPGESAATGVPPQEDRSDVLFHDPVFTKSIGNFFADPNMVLQYHRHSGPSVFYDPSCINEQVFMQTRYNNTVLDPSKMSGSNFHVAWSDPQNQCFHIIKTYTHQPSGNVSNMAAYALCNEQLIQAPDLHTLITSRLSNGLSNLRTAYSKMQDLVKFTPAQGYVWELPRNPNAPQPPNAPPPGLDPSGTSIGMAGGHVPSLATPSVAGGVPVAASIKGSVVGDAKADAGARDKGKSKKNKLIQATHINVLRGRVMKMIDDTAAREHVVLEPIPTEPEPTATDGDATTKPGDEPPTGASSLLPLRKKKVKRERDRDSDAGGSMAGESVTTSGVRKKRKTNKGDKEARKQRASSVVSGN